MALSKKDREFLAAAQEAAELVMALRWTEEVAPDVMPPHSIGTYKAGWHANEHNGEVHLGWTDATAHGYGPIPLPGKMRNGSKNPRRMYSSELLALRAARSKMEKICARKLMEIDRKIAEAKKKQEQAEQ